MKSDRLVLCLCALLLPFSAVAVRTERWEFTTADAFLRGKLTGLIVTSDGELLPGYEHAKLGEFAKQIWCSAVGADGTLYLGTAGPATLQAVAPDGAVRKLFETDNVAVTALARDRAGKLLAATIPHGKILNEAGEVFCQLPAAYVWALVFDKDGHLFAGTGPEGKLYRISPDGQAEEWFDAEDSNLLCLAFDASGALLAGGSDRGQLYRIAARQTATVAHQFEEEEVRAVAVAGERWFVAVNKQKARRPRPPLVLPRAPTGADAETAPPTEPRPEAAPEAAMPLEARLGNLLAGHLYVRHADGRVDKWASWDRESVFALALDGDGRALLALAGQGRVYRVGGPQRWELLFDFDEQNALTLAVRDGLLVFVGTGQAGVGYRIGAQPAAQTQYTSEVLDAKFPATWGTIAWLGRGPVQFATRSGNTSLPDATWSDWSAPGSESPLKITSPPARYLQVRASGANVSNLRVHYLAQNQKPVIASLRVDGEEKKPARRPSPKPAEQKEDGDEEEKTEPTAGSVVAAKKASPVKQISWQASDRDGDKLVYRLFYRADGSEVWIPIALDRPLTKTSYSWDTDSVPDGWYQIKLVASDEEANPVGTALTDERVSGLVKVDNRRPEITGLKFAAGTLSGEARDNLSFLVALEYSINGGEWKTFAPEDGIFDRATEPFAVKLPDAPPPPFTLAVRATDEAGNIGVAQIHVP